MQGCRTPLNIFTDDIFDTIVRCTNQYIHKIKDKFNKLWDIICINLVEIIACIGLLYIV